MPFDSTRVDPNVTKLLKVRERIAFYGFTHLLSGHGQCGCFLGTAEWLSIRDQDMPAFLQPVADELRRRFGPPSEYESTRGHGAYAGEFDADYLLRHKVTARIALEIIDAAIARVPT